MAKHTLTDLLQMQSLPLEAKVRMTMVRIRGWINEYGRDGVYISFSGGKDSTVLMDIIRRQMGEDIPAVFVDVPTQYPELRDFATSFDNVEVLRPKISFMQVCEKYGFPLISKEVALKMCRIKKNPDTSKYWRYFDGSQKGKSMYDCSKYRFLYDAPFDIGYQCCDELKKNPLKQYGKQTKRYGITAVMAEESKVRTQKWMQNGCNAFNLQRPISNPMSFWTEQDILRYIKQENIPICSVYGDIVIDYEAMGELEGQSFLFDTGIEPLKTTGCDRTGCMLCGFGVHCEKKSRFQALKETHPKMYNLLDVCKNNGVTFREAIEWTNEHGNLNIKL